MFSISFLPRSLPFALRVLGDAAASLVGLVAPSLPLLRAARLRVVVRVVWPSHLVRFVVVFPSPAAAASWAAAAAGEPGCVVRQRGCVVSVSAVL